MRLITETGKVLTEMYQSRQPGNSLEELLAAEEIPEHWRTVRNNIESGRVKAPEGWRPAEVDDEV